MVQNGEEAAEFVATIRGEHVVMKTWFMGPSEEAKALRMPVNLHSMNSLINAGYIHPIDGIIIGTGVSKTQN